MGNKTAIDWITRTLAVMAFVCVGTVCFLSIKAIQVPPELNTLTGGLVGSLASMLVKTTPTDDPKKNEPQAVTISQPENKPVPVTETPTEA